MDLLEAIKNRHSVRQYSDKAVDEETRALLSRFVDGCNRESGLHMQLVFDEPKAFGGRMASYGNFSGVRNYIAVVGRKDSDLDEKCGYYGEKIVLYAATLGLDTCWVGLTYKNTGAAEVGSGEKLRLVIALGYGTGEYKSHKIKTREEVMKTGAEVPEWFVRGVDAALLAPTAMNQQKFKFILHNGNKVEAKAGIGFYSKVDLGIVKYHFETGAGKDNFAWYGQ